nr:pollen receptor-like kinase 1 [Lolium perenne]
MLLSAFGGQLRLISATSSWASPRRRTPLSKLQLQMDSGSKKLLGIQPNELRFSSEANKQASCSIHLTNRTDHHIAFKVKNNNPKRYCVQPNISIVTPQSTCNVSVTMGTQSEAPPEMQCRDKFLVQSVVVREGTTVEDVTEDKDMFKIHAGNLVDEVKLKVLFLQPPWHVEEGSEESLSPRPSSSGGGNIHYKDMKHISKRFLTIKPDALCFPFETTRQIMCFMYLTNTTTDFIAFKVKNTNPKRYWVRPNISIVPPQSTYDVNVIMKPQEEAPPNMHCKDMFLVQSVVVREATTTNDLTEEMFKKQAGNAMDKTKLKVLYVQPPSPRQEGSKEGSSPRSSGPAEANINFQDTGSTLHNMTLQNLKDITNNFCEKMIVGRGGFGVVYKGLLGDGKMIAVKKLVQSISGSQKPFENEINLLMKLKHPNIVQLVSYCYETQHLHNNYEGKLIFAENTQCLLCLEYLPNGSLEKYITDASSGLDWPTRYKIIEGISYGLQYLHEQDGGPIIHLDLKPGNILLDEQMLPKVTDFGLSRLNDEKQTIRTKNISGTLGYMPPEYLQGMVTPMSDIFSLGVIIMEVITGHRKYLDDNGTPSTVFIELALQKWRDVLQKGPSYTSLEKDCQQIKRCIQVGLMCLNPERTKRPTMKKIIVMLQGLESINWDITNGYQATPSGEEP